MKTIITFHKAARIEFTQAAAWYETQRPGLGVAFIEEIECCIMLAVEQSQLYAEVYPGMRRIIANRFPYSVYFRLQAQRIVVVAIFHSRRDPKIWQQRI